MKKISNTDHQNNHYTTLKHDEGTANRVFEIKDLFYKVGTPQSHQNDSFPQISFWCYYLFIIISDESTFETNHIGAYWHKMSCLLTKITTNYKSWVYKMSRSSEMKQTSEGADGNSVQLRKWNKQIMQRCLILWFTTLSKVPRASCFCSKISLIISTVDCCFSLPLSFWKLWNSEKGAKVQNNLETYSTVLCIMWFITSIIIINILTAATCNSQLSPIWRSQQNKCRLVVHHLHLWN